MASIKTWTQANGIEINEVEFDYYAHAFEVSLNGDYLISIYADSYEDIYAIRARLDAEEDVRAWEDENGHCVGMLIDEGDGY